MNGGGYAMKVFWNREHLVFTDMEDGVSYFLGSCDGLVIALLSFMVVDYIIGVMCAISDKKISLKICFRGIGKKILIFMLVGMANVLDTQVIGTGSVLKTAVILFYLSNEGMSILNNVEHFGVPIPEKFKKVLAQLHDKGEETFNEDRN